MFIQASNVTLDLPIYTIHQRSLRMSLIEATTGGRISRDRKNRLTVTALDNVSFRAEDGDAIALIGQNGAGKSMLLRTVSGIYKPTRGSLHCEGDIATMFDIFIGFDMEASGRQNIYYRGYFLGLKKAELADLVSEIADFTELGQFMDMPVRTYSSGMALRLAFAIATSVHKDILLMDEWISVGDATFQGKAESRLCDLSRRAKILMLASHSEDLLLKVCNKGLLLHHGKVIQFGEIKEVLAAYHELNASQSAEGARDNQATAG